MNTTTTTTPATTTKAAKTPLEVATKTSATYHESAAQAHTDAAAALRALATARPVTGPEALADAEAHDQQAAKHRTRLAALTGQAEAAPKSAQQLADEAQDRAGAASRRATVADRTLRDLQAELANPNGLPLSGGTTETPEQTEVAAAVAEVAPAKGGRQAK